MEFRILGPLEVEDGGRLLDDRDVAATVAARMREDEGWYSRGHGTRRR